MPPDRLKAMADSVERDRARTSDSGRHRELTEILAWLRYRHAKYLSDHPRAGQG
jgi:hypothetical protein